MIRFILLSLVLVAALAMPALALDPPPFNSGDPDPIPVDGGASFLLAAGGAYAVRKLKGIKAKRAARAAA